MQTQVSPEEIVSQTKRTLQWLWVIFGALLSISVIVAISAASQEIYEAIGKQKGLIGNPIVKHLFYVTGSVMACLALASIPTRWTKNLIAPLAIAGTLIATAWLFVSPHRLNGEARWIAIGPLTMQPSELFKLSLIFLMGWLSVSFYKLWGPKRPDAREKRRHMILLWGGFIYYFGLLGYLFLSSMSVLVICTAFCFIYLFAIKAPLQVIKTMLGTYVIGGLFIGMIVLFAGDKLAGYIPRLETWQARLERSVFSDGGEEKVVPFDSIYDENMQEKYALIAASRGWDQVFGGGPNSSELRHRLPMAQSDYVLAIIIEEYGFFGFFVVAGLYIGWFVLAGKVVVREGKMRTPEDTAEMRFFRRAIAAGVGILIPMQALMNMIVVSGVIVTGQNLPLLSMGGTSLLINSIAMGLLIRIASEQVRKAEVEAKASQENVMLDLVAGEPEASEETSSRQESNESEGN